MSRSDRTRRPHGTLAGFETGLSRTTLWNLQCSRMTNSIRIVLAKVGLDGHDRGVKVVARALRDAGMHVIYAGLWQTPEAVIRTVADEDADWLGLSLLSGAHMTLVPRVLDLLRAAKLDHVGV